MYESGGIITALMVYAGLSGVVCFLAAVIGVNNNSDNLRIAKGIIGTALIALTIAAISKLYF